MHLLRAIVPGVFVSMLMLWVVSGHSTGISAAQAQEERDFKYSARIHSQYQFYPTDEKLHQALDLAKAAGINTVDIEAVWAAVDQGDYGGRPRTYDWGHLDRTVRIAEGKGLRVNLMIMSTPDWVHPYLKDPSYCPEYCESVEDRKWFAPRGEEELRHWSNFVRDLAGRYKGRVNHYEVWNEPNLPYYWRSNPKANPYADYHIDSDANPDAAEYAAFLRTAYINIKEVDPATGVMFGGIAENDLGYLKEYYKAAEAYPDAESHDYFFDVLGVHPYSGSRSPDLYTPDAHFIKDGELDHDHNYLGFRGMKQLMDDEEGSSTKTLFISEYGMPTRDTWGQGAIPDDRRGLYLKRAYELARNEPYVEGMAWHNYHRADVRIDAPEWNMVDENLNPSLTFRAYGQVTGANASNVELDAVVSQSESDAYSVEPELRGAPVSDVSRWELYADGKLVKTQTTAPLAWNPPDAKPDEIMLAAYTRHGDVWHSKAGAPEVVPTPRKAAPGISHVRPRPGSKVRERHAAVRLRIRDGGAVVGKQDIRLQIDGRSTRKFAYSPRTDMLRHSSRHLRKPGRHTVRVVVRDAHGMTGTKSWSFSVVR